LFDPVIKAACLALGIGLFSLGLNAQRASQRCAQTAALPAEARPSDFATPLGASGFVILVLAHPASASLQRTVSP